MDDKDLLEDRLLHDAALVRSARQRIDDAIAVLAVRPFDQAAAAKMRRALRSNAKARAALRRIGLPATPGPAGGDGLRLVAGTGRRTDSTSAAPVQVGHRTGRSGMTAGDAA